jgi:glycosyltransferase involved in cell wall biosynthesis
MRIVIATPLFPPELGEPAPYVYALAKRLRTNHQVTILTYANHIEALEGVHIETIPKKTSLGVRIFFYTRALVRLARRADVIYAQRAVASGLPAYVASLVTRVPFAINFFEDEAWERLQRANFEPQHQGVFRRMQKIPGVVWGIWNIQHFVLRHAHTVVVPSEYVAEDMVRTYSLKKNNVHTNYIPLKEQLKLPFSSKHTSHRVFMNCGLFSWNDVATAMRAVTLLAEKYPDIHLYITGNGPLREELEHGIHMQEVAEHTTFLGTISKAEELFYLKSAEVFLSTALHVDTPNILFEAMRERIPFIATDIPGFRESFTHGESGLRIPPANAQTCAEAINQVFTDTSLAKHLTEGALRLLSEKYSWKTHEKKLLTFLQKTYESR